MKVTQNLSNQNLTPTQDLLKEKIKHTMQNDSTLLQSKNFSQIDTLLKELFTQTNNQEKTNMQLLKILEKLPIFKSFKGISLEIKSLKSLLDQIQTKPELSSKLNTLFLDMKKLDNTILKEHLSKSGIFFESYLREFGHNKISKEEIINNLKSVLVEIYNQGDENIKNQATKIINQLEYFGLFSYLNFSNKHPLNFDWDGLNDGDIEFKREKDDLSTCTIELSLEDFGIVKINLMYEKKEGLNIAFLCEDGEFKNKINSNLQFLKKNISKHNIPLYSLGVHDYKNNSIESFYEQDSFNNEFGIDIRV